MRFISAVQLQESIAANGAMELADFDAMLSHSSKSAREILVEGWLSDVAEVLLAAIICSMCHPPVLAIIALCRRCCLSVCLFFL